MIKKTVVYRYLLAIVLLSSAVLAGCVSQQSPSWRSKPISMEDALRDHIQLGLGYISEGNRDAARHHLSKALEIDSRSSGAHNGMALLYQLEQESELAEEHYKKALRYDSKNSQARNNYGVFLVQQQRIEEAHDQFARVAEDTGYDSRAQAYVNLGITAMELEREQEAVDAWQRAVALNPRLPVPYLELADHFFQKGDFVLARRMLSAFDSLSRPVPRSLWLGVRIDAQFGNKDGMASKGLALKKLYPYSRENLDYQAWLEERGETIRDR